MQSFRKQMALLLVFMFMFTQTMPLGALAANSSSDPNNTKMGNNAPSFTNNSYQSALGTGDSLSNYYLKQYKDSLGWDWLKTTNVSFTAFSGNTPQWNINTFQPLTLKDKLENFLFVQGQYGTGNNTVNAGLGYRTMNAARSSMYGVNVFYDWQATVQGESGYNPSGSHMRLGAGLEYYTGPLEARLNGYYGISPDVQVGAQNTTTGISAWQTVAPGLDLSVGSDFSFWNAPWLKLTATGSWYHRQNGGTINGYNGSPLYANITAALQVTPQLQLTAGGTMGNGTPSNGNFGFQFNLLAPPQPALFLADPVINNGAAKDISYKILQPVQRNNTITVERYTKQSGGATGTVSVTIKDDEGTPVEGATVNYSQTATAAVSSGSGTAVTNASGVALLTNVNLAQPVAATAILGATEQAISIPANTPNPPATLLPSYGNIALEQNASLQQPGALLNVYGSGGDLLASYSPQAPGVLQNDMIVLRGLPPGASITADYQAPSGAMAQLIDASDNVSSSVSPAVTSANVAQVPATRLENVAAANVSSGAVVVTTTYFGRRGPLPGVVVTLTPKALGGVVSTATTGENGIASFNVPAPGKYTLSFSEPTINETTVELTAAAPVWKGIMSASTLAPVLAVLQLGKIIYADDGKDLDRGTILTLTGPGGSTFTPRKFAYTGDHYPDAWCKVWVPSGIYTLTASQGNGQSSVPVTFSSDLRPGPEIHIGRVPGSKVELGSVIVNFKANGIPLPAGSLVAAVPASAVSGATFPSSVTFQAVGPSGSKTFTNLTPGDWYFVIADARAGSGSKIRGIWASRQTVTAGVNMAVNVNAIYKELKISTKDYASKNAVPGVTFSMTPTATDNYTLTSGADGSVAVNLWGASDAGLTGVYKFSADGSYTGEATADVASTSALDLMVTSINTVIIRGSVIDAVTLLPLPGALLRITSADGLSYETTSGEDGSFYYADAAITPGAWAGTASLQGYATQQTQLTLNAGDNNLGQIRMVTGTPPQTTGSVSGSFTGLPTSSPDAAIVIEPLPTSAVVTYTTSGGYQITGLPAGEYTLWAVKTGYTSEQKKVTIVAGTEIQQDIALSADTSASVNGVVTLPNGSAAGGATVRLYQTYPEVYKQVNADSSGAYSITGLPPGNYYIEAESAGLWGGAEIALASGQKLSQNIAVKDSGVYIDVSGVSNSSDAVVTITDDQSGGVVSTVNITTDPQVVDVSLSPGEYTVTATASGYTAAVADSLKHFTVKRGSGDAYGTVVFAANPGSITGYIQNTGSAGVTAALDGNLVEVQWGTPATTGTPYTISGVAAGSHTLVMAKTGYATTPDSQVVKVSPGGSTPAGNIVFTAQTGSLTGEITGVTDFDDITIRLNGVEQRATWKMTTYAASYTISNIVAGEYTLVLSKPGYNASPDQQPVTINAGQPNTAEAVYFSLPPVLRGRIHGTVTDTQGQPAANVLLKLLNNYGEQQSETQTDSNGTYAFEDLSMGGYTVESGSMGQEVYITDGNLDAQVDFEVEKSCVYIGLNGLEDPLPSDARIKIYKDNSLYREIFITSPNQYIQQELGAGRYRFEAVVSGYTATMEQSEIDIISDYNESYQLFVSFTKNSSAGK